eukprot:220770-Amphidinium_carterae.1
MMNIRTHSDASDKCLPGLERFEDAIPPSTARGSDDPRPDDGYIPPPVESDGFESEDVDTAFDHTLKDASSFAHQ